MVKAITYILENDATVVTLCGLNAEGTKTKVYPVVVPNSEKSPYIAVRQIGKVEVGKECDYNYSIQVSSYHTTYDGVTALSAAVIAALKAQGSATVNGVSLAFVNYSNEIDEFDLEHSLYVKIATFDGIAD